MLKIRLRRVGAKKQPSYRIIVSDSKISPKGNFVDQLGLYDPRQDPPYITIDEEKALHWLRRGAQPTEPVERMLRALGTLERVSSS